MRAWRFEPWALAGAIVAVLASAGWFGSRETKSAAAVSLMGAPGFETTFAGEEAHNVGEFRWAESSGDGDEEWAYDVFTPPDIYYDEAAGRFMAKAPERGEEDVADTATPRLELVRVITQPFRVQLVGFAGGPGGYLGLFEEVKTTETFLAATGDRLAGAEATVESFTVEPEELSWPESMAVRAAVAKARVRDERSGEAVWLTSTDRTWTAEPLAVVRLVGAGAEEREVRCGEDVAIAGTVYRVDKIAASPPSIELTRVRNESSPGGAIRLVRTTTHSAP